MSKHGYLSGAPFQVQNASYLYAIGKENVDPPANDNYPNCEHRKGTICRRPASAYTSKNCVPFKCSFLNPKFAEYEKKQIEENAYATKLLERRVQERKQWRKERLNIKKAKKAKRSNASKAAVAAAPPAPKKSIKEPDQPQAATQFQLGCTYFHHDTCSITNATCKQRSHCLFYKVK